ncbi:MAG: ABC transporter substrate-binding protein [Bacteroidota bacterium]
MKLKITGWMACCMLLAACGPGKEDQPESSDNKTIFRYNEISTVSSLDPAAANKLENIWVVNQLFNGLVQLNDELKVVPCIAKSWEIYDDQLEYTFHLRGDVFFHDHEQFEGGKGRRVTAHDFVYSFTRLSEMKEEQSSKYLLGMLERTNGVGVTAPNDSTLKIFLSKPFPPFLEVLTMQYFSVVPREIVAHYGEEFRRNPVGTGPFKFRTWTDEKLVLVRNENYFETEGNERLPYLDGVAVSFIKDKETGFTEFLKGNFDMISGMETMNKDVVLTREGGLQEAYKDKIVMQKSPFLKTDYLGFFLDKNLRKESENPLMKKEVRQAISYAIDRQKIVSYLRYSVGVPATAGFIPPGLPSFDKTKVTGYDYDPEKAKELLKKAGFPDGKGLPEITLNITSQFFEISEAIREQLRQAGISVKINVNPTEMQTDMIEKGQFDFFRKSWVGDYADAQNFFSIFYSKNFSPNGPNYFHFSNEQFDKLYELAMKEENTEDRYGIYYAMDQIIMDEAVVIPVFYDEVLRLVQKNVEGLSTNAMNLLNLKRVKIARRG